MQKTPTSVRVHEEVPPFEYTHARSGQARCPLRPASKPRLLHPSQRPRCAPPWRAPWVPVPPFFTPTRDRIKECWRHCLHYCSNRSRNRKVLSLLNVLPVQMGWIPRVPASIRRYSVLLADPRGEKELDRAAELTQKFRGVK